MIEIEFKPTKTLLCSLFFLFTQPVHANSIQSVNLHGTFHQMGQQYAEQIGDKLLLQMTLTKKNLFPEDPEQKKLFEKQLQQLIQVTKTRYPHEIFEFIQGETNSNFARQNHLTIDDFVYLDNMNFLIKFAFEFKKANSGIKLDACSFIGIKNPYVIIGRNMDFPRDYIESITTYPIVMRLDHVDKKQYPNTTLVVAFPGGISAATFMNDKGLYISINAAGNTPMDYQYVVFQRQSYVGNMLLATMKVQNFTDLKNWVMNTAPDYPYIVNIAGPDSNDLLSMEDSAYNELQGHYPANQVPEDVFKVRTREPSSLDTIEPEIDYNEHILVATNTFHLLNWEPYLNHAVAKQTLTFSYERYHNLMQLARSTSSSSVEELKNIMEKELNTSKSPQGATVSYCGSDPYYANDYSATYYSVVFNTKTRSLSVRYQQKEDALDNNNCSSHWTEWVEFQL